MISVFVREQCRYSVDYLQELVNGSSADIRDVLNLLTKKGIVKTVLKSEIQKDLSELTDDEIIYDDAPNRVFYVFDYVGLIAVKDIVFKCYPKYLNKTSTPTYQLKQVLDVIEKYNAQRQDLNLYDFNGEKTTSNKLSIMIFLIKDYFEYGLYSNIKNTIEENGNGEILWDKTINNTYALISNGEPYYPTIYTRSHVNDEQDFFRRIHLCVLNSILYEFKSADLVDLFPITGIPQTDETIEDLGNREFIVYRLNREIDVIFNTRKRLLLNALVCYIADDGTTVRDNDFISLYGTTSFNLIWENVCNEILEDKRDTPMGALQLPVKLDERYNPEETLISIIQKPSWHGIVEGGASFVKLAAKTLTPDFLSIVETDSSYSFVILDAKHYNLVLEKSENLRGYPGVESVAKQYLYELAYTEFMKRHKFAAVANCFIFPTEEKSIQVKGYVDLPFFKDLELSNISIRLLPAEQVFDCFLSGEKMGLELLQLDYSPISYNQKES